MRAWFASVLLTLGSVSALPAYANPCQTGRDIGSPLRIPLGPANLGSVPEACSRMDMSFQGFGRVLVARGDLYGALNAGGSLIASVPLTDLAFLSIWVPGFEYQFVANATVEADSSALGAGAVGLHQGLLTKLHWQITPYGRVLLPTETVFLHARRYGFDHGVSALYAPNKWLSLSGGFAIASLFTENSGKVHLSYRGTTLIDAGIIPWQFVMFIAGASLRFRGGDDNAFESFDPRVGFRLFPVRTFRVEIGAMLPMWGADRTDVAFGTNVGLSVLP